MTYKQPAPYPVGTRAASIERSILPRDIHISEAVVGWDTKQKLSCPLMGAYNKSAFISDIVSKERAENEENHSYWNRETHEHYSGLKRHTEPPGSKTQKK